MTPEAREQRCIALAYDLVEQRLLQGTATSQETTHFLKLGSSKEKLEQEILEKQRDLMTAKTDVLHSAKNLEILYGGAIEAMKSYAGAESESEDD